MALIRSAYALNNRLTTIISMQNQHNAMYREEEREMMPMLKHYGVVSSPGDLSLQDVSRFLLHLAFYIWLLLIHVQCSVDRTRTWELLHVVLRASKTAEAMP